MDFLTLAPILKRTLQSLSADTTVQQSVRSLAADLLSEDAPAAAKRFQLILSQGNPQTEHLPELTAPDGAASVASYAPLIHNTLQAELEQSTPPFAHAVSSQPDGIPNYFAYGVAQRPYYLPVLQVILLWAQTEKFPFEDALANVAAVAEEVDDLQDR
ncbi:hypothetical protein HK097_009810, partial [Rhizophlyctis rosea]